MEALARRGFTLIELVVIMTTPGLLAAFAIPRIISLNAPARTSPIRALAGVLNSSAAQVKSLCKVTAAAMRPQATSVRSPTTMPTSAPAPTRS